MYSGRTSHRATGPSTSMGPWSRRISFARRTMPARISAGSKISQFRRLTGPYTHRIVIILPETGSKIRQETTGPAWRVGAGRTDFPLETRGHRLEGVMLRPWRSPRCSAARCPAAGVGLFWNGASGLGSHRAAGMPPSPHASRDADPGRAAGLARPSAPLPEVADGNPTRGPGCYQLFATRHSPHSTPYAPSRYLFVIGYRRSRPKFLRVIFTPGAAWRRLYSAM